MARLFCWRATSINQSHSCFRRVKRRAAVGVVLTSLALASLTSSANAAPLAALNGTDDDKLAAQAIVDRVPTVGRASTLDEERILAAVAGALPESDSPGLYTTDAGRPVVRVFANRNLRVAGAALGALGATAAPSRFTQATLAALSRDLENASRRSDASYEFHYDAESDTVALTGNLLAAELPTAAMTDGLVRFTPSAGIERESRYYDTAPFWGGAAIYRSNGGRCTTSFTVKNSSGTRFMVTAGHCGPVGTTWRTAGGVYVGQTVSRPNYPTYDMALIRGGSSYGTHVYMGNRTGYGSKVLGAGDPVVGAYYCVSGTTTYENCGKKVTSLNARFCTSSGCTPGVASYVGGAQTSGGDSGGPLVLKTSSGVHARGLHIGRNTSNGTMYGERWNSVASLFRVSIVT